MKKGLTSLSQFCYCFVWYRFPSPRGDSLKSGSLLAYFFTAQLSLLFSASVWFTQGLLFLKKKDWSKRRKRKPR